MPLSAEDARRWIDGFDAAAAADRRAGRSSLVDPTRALSLALPLIVAARRALAADPRLGARRTHEDEAVRRLWTRLRERLRP